MVVINKQEIEELFSREVPKTSLVQSAPVKLKPAKISLLAPERLKNVEMVLSRLKMSFIAVKEALLMVDFAVLTLDKIEMLRNAAPEALEIDLFVHHPPEDLSNLAIPDLFYMDIC